MKYALRLSVHMLMGGMLFSVLLGRLSLTGFLHTSFPVPGQIGAAVRPQAGQGRLSVRAPGRRYGA